MVLISNIPYKRMRLTSKVNLTKRFSEKYKSMRLTTRLYGITHELQNYPCAGLVHACLRFSQPCTHVYISLALLCVCISKRHMYKMQTSY